LLGVSFGVVSPQHPQVVTVTEGKHKAQLLLWRLLTALKKHTQAGRQAGMCAHHDRNQERLVQCFVNLLCCVIPLLDCDG
jgi:hypothetical protein